MICRAFLSHQKFRFSRFLAISPFAIRYSSSFSGSTYHGQRPSQSTIRESIQKLCDKYPDSYWASKDSTKEVADDLYHDLAANGFIGIAIPEEYGGVGLGISEAAVMMQTISESGGGIAAAQTVHANVYATQPIVKFATAAQRERWLAPLIAGKERTCFGVTEPNSGLDTLSLQTRAVQVGDEYEITGQKIWITNAQNCQRIVLLARTADSTGKDSRKPSQCLSLFYGDLQRGRQEGTVTLERIDKMGGNSVDANHVYLDSFRVHKDDLIGHEGEGFRIVLHGMNAERCLIAGEALGLGYAALRRAIQYASDRTVFGKPIGQNQSIQHPLADSWMQLEAASLMTYNAARMYDESSNSEASGSTNDSKVLGAQCNAAKYLAAEASFKACERAVMTHGGMGYARDYHVERYLRESFVPRIAPVSREMILNFISQRVLDLPRSY
jgi:acyl-CoA dehydrogenase